MSDLISSDDLQQLKEIMEDEFDLLISMFIEESSKLIIDIQSSYNAANSEALRIAAHTLKGSASNMCALAVTDISKQIEDKAKDNDLNGVDSLIEKINTVHPRTCELLKEF